MRYNLLNIEMVPWKYDYEGQSCLRRYISDMVGWIKKNLHFLPRKKLLGKLSLRDFVYEQVRVIVSVCVYLVYECHYSIQHVPLIGVVVVITAMYMNSIVYGCLELVLTYLT